MSRESVYSLEFDKLCQQYEMFGYVVLDEGFVEDLKVLNSRYAL